MIGDPRLLLRVPIFGSCSGTCRPLSYSSKNCLMCRRELVGSVFSFRSFSQYRSKLMFVQVGRNSEHPKTKKSEHVFARRSCSLRFLVPVILCGMFRHKQLPLAGECRPEAHFLQSEILSLHAVSSSIAFLNYTWPCSRAQSSPTSLYR